MKRRCSFSNHLRSCPREIKQTAGRHVEHACVTTNDFTTKQTNKKDETKRPFPFQANSTILHHRTPISYSTFLEFPGCTLDSNSSSNSGVSGTPATFASLTTSRPLFQSNIPDVSAAPAATAAAAPVTDADVAEAADLPDSACRGDSPWLQAPIRSSKK